jgi:putative restriction endonuclease
MKRGFGHISNAPVGSTFSSRKALSVSGIHRPLMAGIWGGKDGAESVVVSGGYEDDKDEGDVVTYTGQGGNDPDTGRQVKDQEWTLGNAGLARNAIEGWPVRVIRGAHSGSPFAPSSGLRYDGLYYVERFWEGKGRSGFKICRFRLVRDDPHPQPWLNLPQSELPVGSTTKKTVTATVQRIVRNTAVATAVKKLNGYVCQICGEKLVTPAGPYAEGAHIRPLGKPHDGPDVPSNVLCLCPNHHVLFDAGAILIADDLTLTGALGALRTVAKHKIDLVQLAYHRGHVASADTKKVKTNTKTNKNDATM